MCLIIYLFHFFLCIRTTRCPCKYYTHMLWSERGRNQHSVILFNFCTQTYRTLLRWRCSIPPQASPSLSLSLCLCLTVSVSLSDPVFLCARSPPPLPPLFPLSLSLSLSLSLFLISLSATSPSSANKPKGIIGVTVGRLSVCCDRYFMHINLFECCDNYYCCPSRCAVCVVWGLTHVVGIAMSETWRCHVCCTVISLLNRSDYRK